MGKRIGRVIIWLVGIASVQVSVGQDHISRGAVIISHFSPDYAQASDECVVLFNASDDAVDLFGHEVRYFTASGSTGGAVHVFDTTRILPPATHLLLASNDTVVIGEAVAVRDLPLTPGMSSSGGQLLLRRQDATDTVLFAIAWGSVTGFVEGMTDAAVWNGDGLFSLSWDGAAYRRSSYNFSNHEYDHTPSDSVVFLPSATTQSQLAAADWSIRFRISQGVSRDTMLIIGMDAAATDGFDALFDLPKPPPPAGNAITAGIQRRDLTLSTGDYLARDIRASVPLADTSAVWIVDLFPAETGSAIVLSGTIEGVDTRLPVIVRDPWSGDRVMREGDSIVTTIYPPSTDRYTVMLFVGDSTPPSASFVSPVAGMVHRVAGMVPIELTAVDKSGIDSVQVFFEDHTTHLQVDVDGLNDSVRSLVWPLPRRLLSDSARFHAFVLDSMGNRAEVRSEIFSVVPDTARRMFLPGWHLFSAPLDPMARPLDVIVPGAKAESVYVFAYSPSGGYYPADSLEPGRGYFLGLLNRKMITFAGRPATELLDITTQPGYNLFSNPGPDTIAIEDLDFVRTGIVTSYAEGIATGLIASGIFGFDPLTTSYHQTESLYPWNGYWIPVLETGVSIRISSPTTPSSGRTLVARTPGWRLRLSFMVNGQRDTLLTLGVDDAAADGFDALFDIPAPPEPPLSGHVKVWFDHPDWNISTGSRFLSDVKGPDAPPEWIVSLQSPAEIEGILEWRLLSGALPADLTFLDVATGGEIRMVESNRYRFRGGVERRFRIRSSVTGTLPQVEDVGTFAIDPPYPNPFNGQTLLSLYLPARSRVSVQVTDILGRDVGGLDPGIMEQGHQVLPWRAELPSGTYVCRVRAVEVNGSRQWLRTTRVVLLR